jgi:uncharacterized protein (TIGR02145 family)
MMVDGKYADETKKNSAWEESWVSDNYFSSGAPGAVANADKNNARGSTSVKGGGRGICPMGWYIPTDHEWAQLLDNVENSTTFTVNQIDMGWWGTDAGKKLKSASTATAATAMSDGSWNDHANQGSNETGFSAVPGGNRHTDGSQFTFRGIRTSIWTASVGGSRGAWRRLLDFNRTTVHRGTEDRSYGFAVRCVKD